MREEEFALNTRAESQAYASPPKDRPTGGEGSTQEADVSDAPIPRRRRYETPTDADEPPHEAVVAPEALSGTRTRRRYESPAADDEPPRPPPPPPQGAAEALEARPQRAPSPSGASTSRVSMMRDLDRQLEDTEDATNAISDGRIGNEAATRHERRARGKANLEATGALAQTDEIPPGHHLSGRLPPASDLEVTARLPGRRSRADSTARSSMEPAGPFSRGQRGTSAPIRGGVGVGGVEVPPEFEFEAAEAEEPALAERLRHEHAQLGELAQEVILLSGQLKRPEAVPGLVTVGQHAQSPPPWQRPSSPPAPPQGAPGGSALPERGQPTGHPATASAARASRLRSRRFHRRWPLRKDRTFMEQRIFAFLQRWLA